MSMGRYEPRNFWNFIISWFFDNYREIMLQKWKLIVEESSKSEILASISQRPKIWCTWTNHRITASPTWLLVLMALMVDCAIVLHQLQTAAIWCVADVGITLIKLIWKKDASASSTGAVMWSAKHVFIHSILIRVNKRKEGWFYKPFSFPSNERRRL